MNKVKLANFEIGGGEPLVLLAGPCVLEGLERSLMIGRGIKEITDRLGIPYVFKASFDKANRSAYHSFRGPGLTDGLKMLGQIKKELGVPVVTDIHESCQAEPAAKVVDILQIPAFLSRQTDLLHAAAQTGAVVNVKKGQFLAPNDMRNVVDKIHESGSERILLTERGASFGYNNLVVDFRNIPDMKEIVPRVIMDCTHSVQRPSAGEGKTVGDRRFVPSMALAAKAFGATGYFFEVHPDPDAGLSDAANMLELDKLDGLIGKLI